MDGRLWALTEQYLFLSQVLQFAPSALFSLQLKLWPLDLGSAKESMHSKFWFGIPEGTVTVPSLWHSVSWVSLDFFFLSWCLTIWPWVAWNSRWPQTCRNPSAFASLVLGLQVCDTRPGFRFKFLTILFNDFWASLKTNLFFCSGRFLFLAA